MTELPPPIPRLGMRNAIFKVLNWAARCSPGGAHRNRRSGASSYPKPPQGSKTVPGVLRRWDQDGADVPAVTCDEHALGNLPLGCRPPLEDRPRIDLSVLSCAKRVRGGLLWRGAASRSGTLKVSGTDRLDPIGEKLPRAVGRHSDVDGGAIRRRVRRAGGSHTRLQRVATQGAVT